MHPAPVQDTGLVVEHVESWDADPAAVIRRLLKPSSKVPSSEVGGCLPAVVAGSVPWAACPLSAQCLSWASRV